MSEISQNLIYNSFRDNTFFIKKDKKLDGMSYAVVRISKKQLKTIIQCVALIPVKFHLRHSNLQKRMEYILLPRLYEIKYFTNINKIDIFGIEITQTNQKDILFGLESFSIQNLLIERGISFIDQRIIKILLIKIKFTEVKSTI